MEESDLPPRPPRHKKYLPHAFAGLLALAANFTSPFEGMALKAYQHQADVPTICSGHTRNVHLGDTATPADCRQLLQEDLTEHLQAVEDIIHVPMTQEQEIAFGDLAFNIGDRAFARSRVAALANIGQMRAACGAMTDYQYITLHLTAARDVPALEREDWQCHDHNTGKLKHDAAGKILCKKILPGLQKRREAEQALCLQGL